MLNQYARFLTATLTASLCLLGAHLAIAQGNSAQGSIAQEASMDVDDGTVTKFVNAYTEVQEINSDYEKRLLNVEGAEQITELQREAQEKMYNAVTSNNISMEEYQRIAQQIGQDAKLRSRVQAQLQSASDS